RKDVMESIGGTPMVELQSLKNIIPAKVFGKMECFNPGLSIKDRIVKHMLQKAERNRLLRPGATIVEATSGNTGYSLAMIAASKGYKCVVTVKDSISKPKVALMEAYGAEIVYCPAAAKPHEPEFYMNKAQSLADEIPGGYYLNQNNNPDNAEAHFLSTGPEIWKQTEGKITHLVACFSTGGTISGTAKFLKKKNPDIKVIAVDSMRSVLKTVFETGRMPEKPEGATLMEGVGKKLIPQNIDFSIIDKVVTALDGPSA